MNADGSNQTNLTNNAADDRHQSFSPDGTIAFVSDRDGNNEIYVMNADGSNQTRLTNNAADDGQPSFSPDGSKIVFYSNRDGDYEIYVMNADGSNQTRLTNSAAFDVGPSWGSQADSDGDGIGDACENNPPACPQPQGYWKNNPNAWPVESLTLGGQTYNKTDLLNILGTPIGKGTKADASLILADQLIAAKLNIENCADACDQHDQ